MGAIAAVVIDKTHKIAVYSEAFIDALKRLGKELDAMVEKEEIDTYENIEIEAVIVDVSDELPDLLDELKGKGYKVIRA